jgi:hypothetical protein
LLEHETLSGVALDAVLSTVTAIEMSELVGIVRDEPPRPAPDSRSEREP